MRAADGGKKVVLNSVADFLKQFGIRFDMCAFFENPRGVDIPQIIQKQGGISAQSRWHSDSEEMRMTAVIRLPVHLLI